MKVVIVTPLFPPDTEELARYVKVLAGHLGAQYDTTVLLYGTLPEAVPGVTLVPIPKRVSLVSRLLHFTRTLIAAARSADILYAENGPSVEFPLILASLITRTPYILHLGDKRAQARRWYTPSGVLARVAKLRARTVVAEIPPPRPEVLPFAPPPTKEHHMYERAWEQHLATIHATIDHG